MSFAAVRLSPLQRAASVALIIMGGASCGGGGGADQVTAPIGGGNRPVSQVIVAPATASLVAGQTVSFVAQALDAAGTSVAGQNYTWSSSNPSVATVNGGAVVALTPGTAIISATASNVQGNATLTVTPVPVASVSVLPGADTLYSGQSVQLTATPKSATGGTLDGRIATWASSDTTIATTSPSGLVVTRNVGTATITATIEGKSASATIVVRAVPVSAIAVAPLTASLFVGQSVQLVATLKDSAGATLTGRAVGWASSDTAVAVVTSTGMVTARHVGTVTITASSEGKGGTAAVSVALVPVAQVRIGSFVPELFVSDTVTVTATPFDSASHPLTGRTITWQSASPSIATVNSSGMVTALSTGVAIIIASTEGRADSVKVTTGEVTPGSVGAGYLATCALAVDRRAYCWGRNYNGSLGNGVLGLVQTVPTPGIVVNSPSFARLASKRSATADGGTFCGLTRVGRLYCWGASQSFNTGVSTNLGSATAISFSQRFADVDVGDSYSCGLTLQHQLYCWGWNGYGNFGDGTEGSVSSVPQRAFGMESIRSFSVGGLHTCAITTDGRTLCAGLDQYQQLGTTAGMTTCNSFACVLTPTPPATTQQFVQIAAGRDFACGLTPGGDAYCWGWNNLGQLGIGADLSADRIHGTPQLVGGANTFTQIVTGTASACGVLASGQVMCWGSLNNTFTLPTLVAGPSQVVGLSVGASQACATNAQGTLWCWGGNDYGELGDGTIVSRDGGQPVTPPQGGWAPY